MFNRFWNWLKSLFVSQDVSQPIAKKSDEPPTAAIEEPKGAEDRLVPPETVAQIFYELSENEPSLVQVEDSLQETDIGDPIETEDSGHVLYSIRGKVYRFADKESAQRFADADSEASMSEDGTWRGLAARPDADDPNWLYFELRNFATGIVGVLWLGCRIWIDPATRKVEWQDYPNQHTGRGTPSWYWIQKGVQDVNAKVWNGKWLRYNDTLGLERIKSYSGSKPLDLAMWKEDLRKLYTENH